MPVAVSQHALDRYKERSGSKRDLRALRRLFCAADSGVPLGNDQFYHRGWIVVIIDGTVKTAFKPRTKKQMDAVHDAIAKRKAGHA